MSRFIRSLTIGATMSLVALVAWGDSRFAWAQVEGQRGFAFKVQEANERLEMTVNTSRVLEFGFKVPKLFVNNPDLVKATPLSPTQVQISALKPGVTQINAWDEEGRITSVDVQVFGDARELELLLRSQFPDASLKVRPLPSSVLISGFVPRAEDVAQIVRLAEDYYPKVIPQMKVAGVQQIQIKVKVYEVSRTKLREFGFDWASINDSFNITQQASGLFNAPTALAGGANSDTIRFGTVSGTNNFTGMLDLLQRNQLAKLWSEPTQITQSGRTSEFLVGGQLPVPIPAGLGQIGIQFRDFGTKIDAVPIALGNGRIRLEVRGEVTEVDSSLAITINSTAVPGFRTRRIETGVELNSGETMAVAGLIQNRIDSSRQGVPWLSDLPWVGAPFRRVRNLNNEIELVILVTPEFVGGMAPEEVPECMPGQMTTEPNDTELYWRGYLEVPKCCNDGTCERCRSESPAGLDQEPFPSAGNYGGPRGPVEAGADGRPVMSGGQSGASPTRRAASNAPVRQVATRPSQTTTPKLVDESLPPVRTNGGRGGATEARPSPSKNRPTMGSVGDEGPLLFGPSGYDGKK